MRAKQMEKNFDRQNLEQLANSIKVGGFKREQRIEYFENEQKDKRKGIEKQMHIDNLSHERELRRIAVSVRITSVEGTREGGERSDPTKMEARLGDITLSCDGPAARQRGAETRFAAELRPTA